MEGQQLAHFRILSLLGAGGMGEVWSAEDTRLGRQVALKLLPAAFTADPVRLGRFEREARLLAALNHPAIAAIHSFESAVPEPADENEPVHFLVMELVQGESLQQRLRRTALRVAEALPLARQLCEALEAAHGQGIVHRDLKPGNVMVDPKGRVKVLDFGLAKALGPPDAAPASGQDLSNSPTLTVAMTGVGILLGTAAYMSPEQATGKSVDKRTDIWAFGAILWEMLTGRPLFSGDSVAATLADVLRGPIDLDALPPGTPAPLRELLRRCLERDRDRRLHDIADARLVLEDLERGDWPEAEIAEAAPARWAGAWLAAAAIAGLLAGAAGMRLLSPGARPGPAEPVLRFEIPLPDAGQARPALSPDGHRIAYASEGRLWIRDLDRLEATPLEGTEGGSAPFWSPDGSSLGYFAERAVWRVSATGGRPNLLTEVPPGQTNTAVWLPGERILFTTGASTVVEVSARGGQARDVVDLLPSEIDFHGLAALGDGALLTSVHSADAEEYGNVTLLQGDRRTVLGDFPGEAVWSLASAEDRVFFHRQGSEATEGIWALPIALDPPAARGEPILVAEGGAAPAVRGDTLVYAPTAGVYVNQLVWLDRSGAIVERVGDPRRGLYPNVALSPDGRTAAVAVAQRLGSNLWTVDLASGRYQQVSFDAGSVYSTPTWSPDGQRLYYYLSAATTDQRIVTKRADTSTGIEEITRGSFEAAISPDERTLVFSRPLPGFRQDLWARDLITGEESEIFATPDWDRGPAFSPDGRFLAFVASGNVVVAPYPPDGRSWQIARGGNLPRWGAAGRHLYFLAGESMMEVAIDPGPPFRAGQAVELFSVSLAPPELLFSGYDVAGEGELFLAVVPAGRPPGLVVVRGWQRALREPH
jgi:eukaryotic-like serine/threonine-protein kinase